MYGVTAMAWTQKFYMADPHFGHQLMIDKLPDTRPFETVRGMDDAIIEATNERVGKNDMLYIVGDFAVTKDENYVAQVFRRLNGRKILIIGNHDVDDKGNLKPSLAKLEWDQPPVFSLQTSDEGQRLFLAHYAHRAWPGQHKEGWHFYGHSHGRIPHIGRSRDVGIDCADIGLGPQTFRELTARYQPETGEWA